MHYHKTDDNLCHLRVALENIQGLLIQFMSFNKFETLRSILVTVLHLANVHHGLLKLLQMHINFEPLVQSWQFPKFVEEWDEFFGILSVMGTTV